MKFWTPTARVITLYLLFLISAVSYAWMTFMTDTPVSPSLTQSEMAEEMEKSPLPEIILPRTPDFIL